MSDNPEDYELVHYGVKGMKWGVRKDRPKMTREEKVAVAKKAAIGTGILLGAVGAAIVTNQLRSNGDKKISDISNQGSAKEKLPDLENIAFFSKPKNRGFQIFNDGNHPKPLSLLDEVFGTKQDVRDELIDSPYGLGVTLSDPQGRKDRAGRTIPHVIIIPNSMRSDIRSVQDVQDKIWPLLEESYADRYEE